MFKMENFEEKIVKNIFLFGFFFHIFALSYDRKINLK